MTPSDITARADELLRQAGVADALKHWPQAEQWRALQDAIAELYLARPREGAQTLVFAYTVGPRQALPPTWDRLLAVTRNWTSSGAVRGPALRLVDGRVLNEADPDWALADPVDAPTEWFPDPADRTVFWVNPPARATTSCEAVGVRKPPLIVSALQDLAIAEAWLPALADYLAFRALAKASEYGEGAQAQAFYSAFRALIEENN